jgi:hypothetical protein
MSKFIKKIMIFIIPILFGLILLELVLRIIPNDYMYKRYYMDLNSNKIEVLILGNSHTYFGLNPKFMKYKTFNLANSSQSFNYDWLILKKHENSINKLKYLIIPIDYCSLYYNIEEGPEKWRVKNYSIYYDISNDLILQNFEILCGKVSNNLLRVYNYLLKNKSDLSCNQFGFGISNTSNQNHDLIATGKSAAIRHTVDTKKYKFTYLNNVRILNYFTEFAKKRKIKLIFITSPGYDSYVKKLNKIQLNNTYSIVQNLCRQNKSIYYFDFLKDKSFKANDYFDADHLNEIGAKKLSMKLDSIIYKIELSN